MTFLSATNLEINWTQNKFKGKIKAGTVDAFHKPLPHQSVDPAQMREDLEVDYDTTLFNRCINEEAIQRTTKSTDLAIEAADQTERP